jgi:preprotein translocase subunit YajC
MKEDYLFGVGEAFAMGGQAPGGGDQTSFLVQFFPFILMFVVIYLLILRPQYKKQKQQQAMIDSLEKGDKIVTSGGIHGTIVGIKDKNGILVIQVAKDVRIEVSRGSVSRVDGDGKEGK